jgi:hypothetical protein
LAAAAHLQIVAQDVPHNRARVFALTRRGNESTGSGLALFGIGGPCFFATGGFLDQRRTAWKLSASAPSRLSQQKLLDLIPLKPD